MTNDIVASTPLPPSSDGRRACILASMYVKVVHKYCLDYQWYWLISVQNKGLFVLGIFQLWNICIWKLGSRLDASCIVLLVYKDTFPFSDMRRIWHLSPLGHSTAASYTQIYWNSNHLLLCRHLFFVSFSSDLLVLHSFVILINLNFFLLDDWPQSVSKSVNSTLMYLHTVQSSSGQFLCL